MGGQGRKGRIQNRRPGFKHNHENLSKVTRGKTKQMFTDVGELIDLLIDTIKLGFQA